MDDIKHYGIKGQKWGVRNQSSATTTSSTPKDSDAGKKTKPILLRHMRPELITIGAVAAYAVLTNLDSAITVNETWVEGGPGPTTPRGPGDGPIFNPNARVTPGDFEDRSRG